VGERAQVNVTIAKLRPHVSSYESHDDAFPQGVCGGSAALLSKLELELWVSFARRPGWYHCAHCSRCVHIVLFITSAARGTFSRCKSHISYGSVVLSLSLQELQLLF